MQLIRHMIEYMKNQRSIGGGALDNLLTSRENVSEIIRVTPSYKLADRTKIIRRNQDKPLRHAYFREYKKLQELCLTILNREKHGLGYQEQKIHGILFDVAWLWEEYVYTFQKNSSIHEIRIRRTVFQYFLTVNEKYFQISIIKTIKSY